MVRHPKLVAALVFLSIAVNPLTAQTHPENVTVAVDFSSPREVNSASGLLVGAGATTPDGMIAPVHPQFWRVTSLPGSYEQASRFAPAIQLVLSDYLCYPVANWCGKQAPYENWQAFEDRVRAVADSMRGKNVMFDVWNEPDNTYFWSGTKAQFFETYLLAYRVLRQELGPGVLIGGPSIAAGYDKAYLKDFLDYCRTNGCEVNFLSWHELNDQDLGIASIAGHVRDARSSFLNTPDYASLNIQRIDINEMIGPYYSHTPGAVAGYLNQIELGGADGAAKTCWNDPAGVSECFNGSLDGLLTSDSHDPRAVWWVYKAYADGVKTRVSSASSDIRVVPLASGPVAGGTTAQILVGYFNAATVGTNLTLPIDFALVLQGLKSLSFLSGAHQVHLKVEKIPNTGEAALSAPILIGNYDLNYSGSQLSTYLTNLSAGETFLLTLSRGSH